MHRREIGSEYHICDGLEGKAPVYNIFDYLRDFHVSYFDSGRSALRALLEQIKCEKVLLPGYICESVRACFAQTCNVAYYHVDDDLKIDWADLLKKSADGVDVVYLHYFNGYIGKEYDYEALLAMKEQYGFVIIEDTTHSLFSAARTVGDYCVCSLRKWFPIADGGVMYTANNVERKQLPENAWSGQKRRAMVEKGNYLSGITNEKKTFMDVFHSTEELLDSQDSPFAISGQSLEALKTIDCRAVVEARKGNYAVLQDGLECQKTACGGIDQVPLFFTVRVEDRDQLRMHFIRHNIFCPVHWPLYDELKQLEQAVQNNKYELSIPIDQRYDADDMTYISKVYHAYAESEKNK